MLSCRMGKLLFTAVSKDGKNVDQGCELWRVELGLHFGRTRDAGTSSGRTVLSRSWTAILLSGETPSGRVLREEGNNPGLERAPLRTV